MSDSCSSSSFDSAPGSNLDDDLVITVSTRTLHLTTTDTSQRNDSEGSEAIAETPADTLAQIDQTIHSSSQQDAVLEPSHSEGACQSNGAIPAAELMEEIYTIAETAKTESSSDGAESRATVLVPGFEGLSEETSVNHTAPKEEPAPGVLPTSISTAHGEGSDDNNDLTISETFHVHNETGQDDDEMAMEDTPRDDYAESSTAVQETIADLLSPDIAQDRSRREEGSWNAKEEEIHHEVWKQFDIRMKMLRSEKEDLGARFATRLEERQREVQQNDTQENEDEDGIITEIEEEFRQEREDLQNDIDDLNEAFTLEFSEREFHELRSQEREADEEDPQEASTGAYTLQIADASNANNDVDGRTSDTKNVSKEVDVDPEDDLEEVEVDTEDDEAVYSNTEHDVEGENGDGIITKEERADDEGVEMKVTEETPIQPLDEQLMGDTVPASFYRVSAETDPANYVGRMTTTMGPGNPADQMISQQASVDALNPGTFSDDNVDASQNPDDCCSDADGESSSRDDKFDRADDDESNHDPSEAHASTNPSILQRASFESKETESQGRVAGELEAIEGCESPAISGDMGESGEVVATGNTASPGPSNDSGPASIVPTSTIPTNTNTIPTHTVAAEHASQRRVRHHARKAQPKKYGVNTDNGKKGGS